MNDLVVSLGWCWAQSFVVASLAIGLSRLAMRKSPAAGAAIAWAGVLAALGLAVLVPVPLPRWRLQFDSTWAEPKYQSFQQNPPHRAPSADTTDDPQSAAMFNLELLRDILSSVERSQTIVADHRTASRIVLGVVAVGICYNLGRTLFGWWAIARLHRTSRITTDDRLDAVVEELADRLHLRAQPQFRESDCLVSAAVIGGWRPAVVLPAAWREWTPAELRAVIAHELAHVGRRDFALRLVASLAVALQCAQPLVYWLRRQLLLAQEMAADEMAASAVGSRGEYLHALSKLALRQDAHPIDGSVGLLLPVFSGFLLRRIEMLRAKDGSPRRAARLLQWSAIALVGAVAASTAALRVLAQPPETQSDGSVRVAKAIDTKPMPASVTANASSAASTLFRRPPFDLTALPVNKHGGFLVRLGEILRRSDCAPLARLLGDSWLAGWKDAFPMAEPPNWSLADIEYIAGDFKLTFRRNDHPQENDTPDQVMFGATCLIVRFQKPLDGPFVALTRVPGSVEKSYDGTNYTELPLIPAIGPLKPCVCCLDDRTFLFAFGEEFLRKQLDKLATGAPSPAWQKAWQAVEGGLITAVAAGEVIHPLSDEGDPDWKRVVKDVFTQARLYAVGIDWQEASDGARVLKCKIDCDTQDSAGLVHAAIQDLIGKAKDEVSKPTDRTGAEAKTAKLVADTLQQIKAETHQVDDHWQVDVQFTGPLDIQGLLKP